MNAGNAKSLTVGLQALFGFLSVCNVCIWCPLAGMIAGDFIVAIRSFTPEITSITKQATSATSTAALTITYQPSIPPAATTSIEPPVRAPSEIPFETSTPSPTLFATIPEIQSGATPTPVCVCKSDYKCADFGGHASAQACFDYCISQGYEGIRNLDKNNNGLACEDN